MEMVAAGLTHRNAFREYALACSEDGLALYQTAMTDSDAYLHKRIAYAQGLMLPDGWPPISLYFCMQDGEIMGAIRFRHGSNRDIQNVIGHIGYETLPAARGQGIATFMLKWVSANLVQDRAVITCDSDNIASKTVIEKCGGQMLDSFYCADESIKIVRYQLWRNAGTLSTKD